jgi:sugar (pentulose or hexulose) kinase
MDTSEKLVLDTIERVTAEGGVVKPAVARQIVDAAFAAEARPSKAREGMVLRNRFALDATRVVDAEMREGVFRSRDAQARQPRRLGGDGMGGGHGPD